MHVMCVYIHVWVCACVYSVCVLWVGMRNDLIQGELFIFKIFLVPLTIYLSHLRPWVLSTALDILPSPSSQLESVSVLQEGGASLLCI